MKNDPQVAKREAQAAMDVFRGSVTLARETKAAEVTARKSLEDALLLCGIDRQEAWQIIGLCESGYHVEVSKP